MDLQTSKLAIMQKFLLILNNDILSVTPKSPPLQRKIRMFGNQIF